MATARAAFAPTIGNSGPTLTPAASPTMAARSSPATSRCGPSPCTTPPVAGPAVVFSVLADRRFRVPVRLPHRGVDRPGGLGRLAVRARDRLAERVRRPARPGGGQLPVRPVRHLPPGVAGLRAGHERPRNP